MISLQTLEIISPVAQISFPPKLDHTWILNKWFANQYQSFLGPSKKTNARHFIRKDNKPNLRHTGQRARWQSVLALHILGEMAHECMGRRPGRHRSAWIGCRQIEHSGAGRFAADAPGLEISMSYPRNSAIFISGHGPHMPS